MYRAKLLESKQTGPGTWNVQEIGVYRHERGVEDELVGQYTYNYSSGLPFAAFEQDGQWYALATRNYTCTQLLKLPEMEWIGGETPNQFGFCPVELYVPAYRYRRWRWERPRAARADCPNTVFHHQRDTGIEAVTSRCLICERDSGEMIDDPAGDHEWRFYQNGSRGWDESTSEMPIRYERMGFVAGCHWGDDSSWKLETFDLSKVKDGILTRSAPWGYVELPESLALPDCIRMDADIDARDTLITLDVAARASFRFDNGVFRDFRLPRET